MQVLTSTSYANLWPFIHTQNSYLQLPSPNAVYAQVTVQVLAISTQVQVES